MDVIVIDAATGVQKVVKRLNPSTNSFGSSRMPFTSGGFNTAPVWKDEMIDISEFKGKTVRLRFLFATRDGLYNNFRGWIVDEVKVQVSTALSLLNSEGSTEALVPADELPPPPKRVPE